MTPYPQRDGSDLILLSFGMLEPTMVRVSPRWRPRNRANHVICYINVTGLVAVLLVLILVMVSVVPMHVDVRRVSVDLARVNSPVAMWSAEYEDAIVVAVTHDGWVFIGTDPIRSEDISLKIRECLARGSKRRIYIRADARARYAWVKRVLEGVQASGVERVGFLVEQRKTRVAAP